MTWFRSFTPAIRELFFGNLFLLLCSLFYLAWWILCFHPHSSGGTGGAVCLTIAFGTGIAAVVLMSLGIYSLSQDSKGLPIGYILFGGILLYVILLMVTVLLFHRQTTSELLILHIWVVLEISAVTVLHGISRFGLVRTAILLVLIGTATVIGLICYVLYYRLDGISSYQDGMVPLITDALTMVAFLGFLSAS